VQGDHWLVHAVIDPVRHHMLQIDWPYGHTGIQKSGTLPASTNSFSSFQNRRVSAAVIGKL
jgi:hypothetical protein